MSSDPLDAPAQLSPASARSISSAMHWEAAAAFVGARCQDAARTRALPPPVPGDDAGAAQFWGHPASGRERFTPADVHAAWLGEKTICHGEMVLGLVDKARQRYEETGCRRRVSSAKMSGSR